MLWIEGLRRQAVIVKHAAEDQQREQLPGHRIPGPGWPLARFAVARKSPPSPAGWISDRGLLGPHLIAVSLPTTPCQERSRARVVPRLLYMGSSGASENGPSFSAWPPRLPPNAMTPNGLAS